MRIVLSSIMGAALLAGCVSVSPGSEDGGDFAAYVPPTPGALLTIQPYLDGVSEAPLRQLVVASGADYAVYANLVENDASLDRDVFFIEYSGVHWRACGAVQPSEDERRALAGMWPLKTGANTAIQATEYGVEGDTQTISVEEVRTVADPLLGEQPVAVIVNAYALPEYSSYAPRLHAVLRLDWGKPGSAEHMGHDALVKSERVSLDAYRRYVDTGVQLCAPEPLEG